MPEDQPVHPTSRRFFYKSVEIPQTGWGLVRYIKPDPPYWDVTLDIQKIATHLRTFRLGLHKGGARDHDLEFDVQANRLRDITKSLQRGRWQMIHLKVNPDIAGGIEFVDGLHRFALLHAAGYDSIKAKVIPADLKLIKSMLGFRKTQSTPPV